MQPMYMHQEQIQSIIFPSSMRLISIIVLHLDLQDILSSSLGKYSPEGITRDHAHN